MAGLALSVTQFHDFEPSSVMLLMARCAMHGIVFGPSTAKSRSCDHDEIGGLALMGFPGSSPGHVRGVGMEGELAIRSANCIVALKAEPLSSSAFRSCLSAGYTFLLIKFSISSPDKVS